MLHVGVAVLLGCHFFLLSFAYLRCAPLSLHNSALVSSSSARLLPSLAVDTSFFSLSLSHLPCFSLHFSFLGLPPLVVFSLPPPPPSPFFFLRLPILQGWVGSFLSLGGPLSPPLLVATARQLTIHSCLWPLLPHTFPPILLPLFRSLVYSRFFNCFALVFSFLFRFSFLPSSMVLIASHPWLSLLLFIGLSLFLASSVAFCLVLFIVLFFCAFLFGVLLPLRVFSHPPYTPPLFTSRAPTSGRLLPPMGLAFLRGWVWVILWFWGSPLPLLHFAAATSADFELLPVATCFRLALHPSSSRGSLFSLLCLLVIAPSSILPYSSP